MASKPRVVLGFVGTTLERGRSERRWEEWRPTVALCSHEDLEIDRLELLHPPAAQELARLVAADVKLVSPGTTVRLHPVTLTNPWDFETVYGALADFTRAYPFAPEREDYLVHITTGTHVAQICWFLLVESRELPAKLLQTAPPRRGSGPEGTHQVIDLDLSKYDRLARRFQADRREATSFLKAGIDTRNPAFNALISRIEHVAIASKDPLLLEGPTGAGKSQLARRIYELRRSRRQVEGAFVDVNCATLRGDAAMSALFGHVRGAFTGAVKDRPGLLRQAHGGVLFLDEIGELGADEQAMLLRAVEERAFYPVGSDREVKSDFQLIAGTNRDLARRVSEGLFREDLLARVNLWTFRLPALRDRPEDVEPNLEFELDRLSRARGVRITLNAEARRRFLTFATSPRATWPGNFRDFGAALSRLATLADGGRIDEPLVEEEIARLEAAWRGAAPTKAEDDPVADVLGDRRAAKLDPFDRVQLAHVLTVVRASPTLSEAGRTLFAESRKTKSSTNDADRLRKYLARFDLDFQQIRGSADRP